MPDWSYRTVFRPILFRLPGRMARDLTLRSMGRLSRLPLGAAMIDFLGHMRPPDRLQTSALGLTFPTPIGLGGSVDIHAIALPALSRFGFGFVEIGPVTRDVVGRSGEILRDVPRQTLIVPDWPENPGVDAMAWRLEGTKRVKIPIFARLACRPDIDAEAARCEVRRMAARLAEIVDVFVLMVPVGRAAGAIVQAAREVEPSRPILLHVSPEIPLAEAISILHEAMAAGVQGVVIDGREKGPSARDPALRLVAQIRQVFGDSLVIVASAGIHSPDDALNLREAGADLLLIDSGLVFSGPGLPKRINEAILFADEIAPSPPPLRPAEASWFWLLLMGLGMLFGGILALAIAATRVVLPYDEGFVAMDRGQIHAINEHLLAFMAHDRVTLAGTMMTVGLLYAGLSLRGVRRGLHWAKVAVVWSAVAGFASFFLFLGFGYFDPFHAFVTAILFQLLLMGVHSRLDPPTRAPMPGLVDDWRWRLSLWGQLAWIVQASAFLVAGAVIATVGVTRVFVPEDLEFLGTSAEAIRAAHPRLVPLVAHDRAMLGGMLVASGLAFLLPTLWGFRRGEKWLWWTIGLAGLPGYACALIVHLVVGYHSLKHLAPAFAGLGLFAAGLGLSYPYLCGQDPLLTSAWSRHRAAARGKSSD